MKLYFCTLFDSYYLSRGLVLYHSLKEHCDCFQLYVYTFDSKSYQSLRELNLENAVIIDLADFETQELLKVKPYRTSAEYCWTCSASTIWYTISQYNLDHCTYLDADIYFFSSPQSIIDEIGSSSIALAPHNFSSGLKKNVVYGKYCVHFNYFKNDSIGLAALKWWKDECIKWCYAKWENGKYGDQKYLDFIEEKFSNVHIIRNLGAGVAPWNQNSFKFSFEGDKILVKDKKSKESNQLVFYHYQSLKFKVKDETLIINPHFLRIQDFVTKYVYTPYVVNLLIYSELTGYRKFIYNKISYNNGYHKVLFMIIKTFFKKSSIIRDLYTMYFRTKYNRPRGMKS